jgi:hypothetical protein
MFAGNGVNTNKGPSSKPQSVKKEGWLAGVESDALPPEWWTGSYVESWLHA